MEKTTGVSPACLRMIGAGRKTMIRSVVADPSAPCPQGETGDRLWLRAAEGEPALVVIERTTLQRLQEIADEDLDPEGGFSRETFAPWWDSVHPRPGTRWNDNPWVWVIAFRLAT